MGRAKPIGVMLSGILTFAQGRRRVARQITVLQRQVALRDPQDCTDQADDLALLEALFDPLVRRQRDGSFAPALAESWRLSDDARTWTFRLKPGLRFHDGSALDAAAVVFSIRRMQRPDVGATLGAPAVWGQYLIGANIVAEDSATVSITTEAPTADLLDVLCSGYVLPPNLADMPGFSQAPVGSGAYRCVAASQGEVRMAANVDWHGGAVAHDEIIWRQEPDASARATAVASGAAHVATRLPHDADSAQVYRDPVAIICILNAARGPFADARVRRAVNMAIDRRRVIAGAVNGAAAPLHGFVSPGHWGADAAAEIPYDPEAARRLLADAGYAAGLSLTIDRPETLPDEAAALTAAVQAELAAIDVNADIRVHADRTAYAEMVRAKNIGDMCLFDSSPMSAFRVISEKLDGRRDGAWRQGYANPEVEALLDKARTTVDPNARVEIYRKCYRTLQADPPWLFLYNRLRAVRFFGDVGDWRMRPDGVLDVVALPPLV